MVVTRHLRYHIVTTTARPATIRNIFPFCRIPALIAPLRFSLLSHHCDNRASPLVPICVLRTYLLLSKPNDYPTITEGLPKDKPSFLYFSRFYCIYTLFHPLYTLHTVHLYFCLSLLKGCLFSTHTRYLSVHFSGILFRHPAPRMDFPHFRFIND